MSVYVSLLNAVETLKSPLATSDNSNTLVREWGKRGGRLVWGTPSRDGIVWGIEVWFADKKLYSIIVYIHTVYSIQNTVYSIQYTVR